MSGEQPEHTNLVLNDFDNAGLGTISDVTVWVEYLTTSTPGNDSYQFEVAVDGTNYNTTIVANTTAGPADLRDSQRFGRCDHCGGGRHPGRPLPDESSRVDWTDNYSVNWDVGYIVVTHTPAGGDTLTVTSDERALSRRAARHDELKLLQVLDLTVDANDCHAEPT